MTKSKFRVISLWGARPWLCFSMGWWYSVDPLLVPECRAVFINDSFVARAGNGLIQRDQIDSPQ